jgi:hypothetical protein
MHKFLPLLFILVLVPGLLSGQEIIRTSRYERAGMSTNSSDKINVLRERYGIPLRSLIISPSFGDDIILAVCRTNLKGADGSFIQGESPSVFFKDDALTTYYMLFNREPIIIGTHAYSFDVNGIRYQIHFVKGGSVITRVISANEAFLSQDSYMIKIWGSKKHEP